MAASTLVIMSVTGSLVGVQGEIETLHQFPYYLLNNFPVGKVLHPFLHDVICLYITCSLVLLSITSLGFWLFVTNIHSPLCDTMASFLFEQNSVT